jgi:hypothetical protein
LRIPKGSTAGLLAAIESVPAEKRAVWRAHRVSDGDTVEAIAKRYNTTPLNLLTVNRSSAPQSGDLLIVPYVPPAPRYARKARWTPRSTARASYGRSPAVASKSTAARAKAPASKVTAGAKGVAKRTAPRAHSAPAASRTVLARR